MASSPQSETRDKTLYVGNLERLGDAPLGGRRSALLAALEPHRTAIMAALAAGHSPHAIARVLVEGPQGDDPDVRTWSRQSVQRAIARLRDAGRELGAREVARRPQRPTHEKSQIHAQAASPRALQRPVTSDALLAAPDAQQPAQAQSYIFNEEDP